MDAWAAGEEPPARVRPKKGTVPKGDAPEVPEGRPGPKPQGPGLKPVPHQCKILPATKEALYAAGGAAVGAVVLNAWAAGEDFPPKPSKKKIQEFRDAGGFDGE